MSVIDLSDAAKNWRSSIECCSQNLSAGFEKFPLGSCGEASITLGAWLTELGLGEFTYVLGARGTKEDNSWESHAWIEQNGVVIDITADQFTDMHEPVIVSESSSWHPQFKGEAMHIAHYSIYAHEKPAILERDFVTIKGYLNAT